MKPEAKKTKALSLIIDLMNFDFGKYEPLSKKSVPSMWLRWWLSIGFNSPAGREKARAIQKKILDATAKGSVLELTTDMNRHLKTVKWDSEDGRTLQLLPVVETPESHLYLALAKELERFWSLKRCPECGQFFSGKQKYWPRECLRKLDSKKAQERVERARRKRRFDEIFPRLLKLQKMAKTMLRSKIEEKIPQFDSRLLTAIIEGKEPLKELVSRVKYRNRKILMEAKL